jgi:hypothetical protein
VDGCVVSSDVELCTTSLVTTPGTLPEDGNVMPKHVGSTIYN